jgi:murein DD-endopeptidase MepM/ murein hydrolase activator NlpD
MKTVLWIFVFCLIQVAVIEAQVVKVFSESNNNEITIYCSNDEYCPVSILADLELKNLNFSEGAKRTFVIPERSTKFKIGSVTPKKNGSDTKFGIKIQSVLGDVTLKGYDADYEYDLPYKKGSGYKIDQGYNGAFSHRNENALDFTMPEGTEILAVRDGKVIQVVQNNTKSCPDERCDKYNNYITIMHPDGTFASYAHIRQNGSLVKVGDTVTKSAHIGYSGNVGRSSGPHLHFACFVGGFEKQKTIKTKFRVDTGTTAIGLLEGKKYVRDY